MPSKMWLNLLSLTISFLFLPSPSSSCFIKLGQNGSFSLAASPGTSWLTSGPVAFRMKGKLWSTADGSLVYVKGSNNVTKGQDMFGSFIAYSYKYQAETVFMETTFKVYNTTPMVIFTQRFPQGLEGSQTDFDETMTTFPSFNVRKADVPLGYMAYGGILFGNSGRKYGEWEANVDIPDGMSGGPLLLFDEPGNALMVSPYDNFMASSVWYDKGAAILNWGIMGGVNSLPVGFESSTIAFCSSSGIRETFSGWGHVLKETYGKTNDVISYHKSLDNSLKYLGYWTDNGAYYHYNTEPNQTYETTLLGVKDWANTHDVPFRYFQLDSWFYPKGGNDGVITWDAMKSVFPSGLKGFHKKLGLPIVAHNRYWSINTTYATQNGGKFKFQMGKLASLPVEEEFWVYLLSNARENWGLEVYEQDWMNAQVSKTAALMTNLTLGRMWLKQMADAALRNEQGIQYCMTLSRQALQSVEFPAVTQARVSGDYHFGHRQWDIGVGSLITHALGVAPSKDTFWTTQKEPGKFGNKVEPWPTLQTAVAILSTGPVGPGDRLGDTNRTRLMTCCNGNGLILKPSVPALAIDDQVIGMVFSDSGVKGQVWSTYSTQLNKLYGIILAADISKDVLISPQKAGFLAKNAPKFDVSVLYQVQNGTANILAQTLNSSSKIQIKVDECSTDGEFFCVLYTSPIMSVSNHRIALLGDLTKWVPMSEQRMQYISLHPHGVEIIVTGSWNETISFSYLMDGNVLKKTDKVNKDGFVVFFLAPGS